jgi:ankyrin repeat protein
MDIKLHEACKEGNLELVNLMIDLGGHDWNWGLMGACRGGHLELANLMIEHGANDRNWGLMGACRGGHLEIVNLMIEHGANDWNWGLQSACYGGHLELANLLIEHGATDWNMGLVGACKGGHLDIVNLMLDRGEANDFEDGLEYACRLGGNLELARYMIRLMIKRKIKVYSEYRYLEIVEREEISRDLLNGALVRDRLLGLGPEFDVIDKYLF